MQSSLWPRRSFARLLSLSRLLLARYIAPDERATARAKELTPRSCSLSLLPFSRFFLPTLLSFFYFSSARFFRSRSVKRRCFSLLDYVERERRLRVDVEARTCVSACFVPGRSCWCAASSRAAIYSFSLSLGLSLVHFLARASPRLLLLFYFLCALARRACFIESIFRI